MTSPLCFSVRPIDDGVKVAISGVTVFGVGAGVAA